MANYNDIISAATATPRPGTGHQAHTTASAPITAGLELSDIVYKPASWFRLNPANEIFRDLKTEQYLADLEADIRKDGVTDNLVAMPDGLIISGESRVICSLRIDPEKRLPVRLVLSDLAPEEQEKRLILSNLLRFEIPDDVRLVLAKKAGLFSVPRTEAAEVMGKSLRQVKRDAAVLRDAESIAAESGRNEPTAEDVASAREKKNAKRKAPSTGNNDVRILLSPILEEMDKNPLSDVTCFARKIKEALGWQ